eukprot:CAMPEP_0198202008 /NCGR_PEP_ID=MMETSP1445-20131203/5062_1 /TAXON_ID=36898 /ORGANISM="Pyramimonas sp., Strain CCMP2087" /LENGTH=324 /DNA_ID=CAMNT_0043872707 /DNA_START=57 /DNA_END=1028 /DNA_ORIENTATION=-
MPSIFELIRTSCAEVVSPLVEVDEDAAARFAKALDLKEVLDATKSVPGCRFPVRFDSLEEEVNFLAVASLLCFGSGFRSELHNGSVDGSGAYGTITRGVLAMYLAGSKLDADFMINFEVPKCGELFGLPIRQDVPGPHPAIMISQPGGPLRELVNKLVQCMQDTGRVLKELQARSLGAFILQQAADTSTPLAASLVNSLQRFFKVALHDTADWKTTEVHFTCKAQLLVAQLYRRFQADDQEQFRYSDVDQFTVLADSVMPAVLRSAGVLRVSASLAAKLDNGEALSAGSEEEVALRAATIRAGDVIVQAADRAFTAMDLSFYIW